ncbi:hypothetical protein N0V84_006393 [Fusarium piperis]|uniref:Uncharacterized protein n=1 Tax=Fusarium piperis TaxID=1435070 RepID=A0A9W8WBW0_9HYPO|nr:hypothetical protein N0V84_006393 [Fusarium piperis]
MSAAVGPPPPPPNQGGNGDGNRPHRRALGDLLVEGDSGDETYALPAELNLPCRQCINRVLTSGHPLNCTPGRGKSCQACRKAKSDRNVLATNAGLRRLLREIITATNKQAHVLTDAVPPPAGQKSGGKKAVFTSEFYDLARRWRTALASASLSQTPAQSAYAPSSSSMSPVSTPDSPFTMPSSALVAASEAMTLTRRGGFPGAVAHPQFATQFVNATAQAFNSMGQSQRATREAVDRLALQQEQAATEQQRLATEQQRLATVQNDNSAALAAALDRIGSAMQSIARGRGRERDGRSASPESPSVIAARRL